MLGGDCSVLLGSALAMKRRAVADELPYGLVYIDGHSDFRHPGNASYVGAAAGEDLALATGRGQPDLTDLEGLKPYIRDVDVVLLGIRPNDDYRLDLQAAGITMRAVPQLRAEGAGPHRPVGPRSARRLSRLLGSRRCRRPRPGRDAGRGRARAWAASPTPSWSC